MALYGKLYEWRKGLSTIYRPQTFTELYDLYIQVAKIETCTAILYTFIRNHDGFPSLISLAPCRPSVTVNSPVTSSICSISARIAPWENSPCRSV